MGTLKTPTAKEISKAATKKWRESNPGKIQQYSKTHYERHGKKIMVDGKLVYPKELARIRNKKYVLEYLSTHPCVDCQEPDPIVLEFDHVRGEKDMAVSVGIFAGWSLARLANEIAKCDVRCANCHRKKTHERKLEAKIL